jgi:putative endonuclease
MRIVSQTDRTYTVYIMSNRSRTLYIGMTNNLARRVYEHRHPVDDTFTARYHLTRLVYVETFSDVLDAIAYEKRLKGWTRARKLELIEASYPEWRDLAEEWFGPTL